MNQLENCVETLKSMLDEENFNYEKPNVSVAWSIFKKFADVNFSVDEGLVISDERTIWSCVLSKNEEIVECAMIRQFSVDDEEGYNEYIKYLEIKFKYPVNLFTNISPYKEYPHISFYSDIQSYDFDNYDAFYENVEKTDTMIIAQSNMPLDCLIEFDY